MERMEIVESRRGQGTFVTEVNEVIVDLKEKLQTDMIAAFVHNMKELGFTQEEMLKGLQNYIDREGGK
jgi:GntR family transcriptional regulator